MQDYFILRDHEGIIRACIDISDRPSCFEKLIGFGLDPFIYRLRWITPDIAEVYEYWWGTKTHLILRVKDKLPVTTLKSSDKLPKGCVASPTPYRENRMI
jgi:hypothetical protein